MKNIKRFFQNIRFSLQGLGSNKMTSFLTLLGIIIGIGSVIGLMSIGQGAQQSIIGELEGLGTDIVTISAGASLYGDSDEMMSDPSDMPDPGSRLNEFSNAINDVAPITLNDYLFLKDEGIENIDKVSFTIASPSDVYIEDDDSKERISVVGTDIDFKDIYTLSLESGEFFSQDDIDSESMVVVLGSEVLLNQGRKIGGSVNINGEDFKIIGILGQQDETLLGSSPNTEMYIPYSVVYDEKISSIVVHVIDDEILADTTEIINTKLSEFRGVDEPDFSILSIQSLISSVTMITDIFTMLLSAIAAISLLVGGIGISNVMLITVTQRTREIGIRKAMGARRSDILIQFLTEAIFLTLIGGMLGIGFGYLLAFIAQRLIDIPALVTFSSVLMAVGISVGIGLVFGILPANKASKLNPIDALRYE